MKSLKKLTFGLAATALLSGSAFAVGTTTNPTIVHVVGSSAFRPGATAAIIDELNAGHPSPVCHVGFIGTAGSTVPLSAGEVILANGTLTTVANGTGTATIIVECYWTGSLSGVVDLAIGNSTGTYLDLSSLTDAEKATINSSTVVSSGNTYGGKQNTDASVTYPASSTQAIFTATTGQTNTVTLVPEVADMAMSDTDVSTIANELGTASLNDTDNGDTGGYTEIPAQGSFPGKPDAGQPNSPYYTDPGALASKLTSLVTNAGASKTANAAKAGYVGIVPFIWASNIAAKSGGTAIATNMTQQTAYSLMNYGFVPQQTFTGGSSTADLTNYFYLIGRNEDSGTRIGAVTEAQYDLTASPHQYALTGNGIANPQFSNPKNTTTSGAGVQLFPVVPLNTEPSIIFDQNGTGQSGYASGSNVSTALKTSSGTQTFTSDAAGKNSGSAFFVGYIGIADAQAALAAGATQMSYNGVAYTVPNVQSGAYTFWYYEHCYRFNIGISTSDVSSFINSVADLIYGTDADVSVTLGSHDSTGTASGILASTVKAARGAAGGPVSY